MNKAVPAHERIQAALQALESYEAEVEQLRNEQAIRTETLLDELNQLRQENARPRTGQDVADETKFNGAKVTLQVEYDDQRVSIVKLISSLEIQQSWADPIQRQMLDCVDQVLTELRVVKPSE
jgi:hypothetical protein